MKTQMPCGGPDPQNIPADFPDEKRAYSAERELALCLLEALSTAGERVTLAESCTGGLLSAVFCSVPGASEVYDGGLVSYANSVKHRLLSVEESVLSTFGPVSEQCCAQMAKGACALFSAQLGLAVTGFAGPGGGTPEKPVGTVYLAGADTRTNTGYLMRLTLGGYQDRAIIRTRAALYALDLLRRMALGLEVPESVQFTPETADRELDI